jgi:hypothetical protein
MRQRISCPTSFSISAASRTPLREAGIKARTPTSTLNPPLIAAVTVPMMVAFSLNACSSDGQSMGREILPRATSWLNLQDRATFDADQHLVRRALRFHREGSCERQNAFSLEADSKQDVESAVSVTTVASILRLPSSF